MGYCIFKVWDYELGELFLFLYGLSRLINDLLYTTCLTLRELIIYHNLRCEVGFYEQTVIKIKR